MFFLFSVLFDGSMFSSFHIAWLFRTSHCKGTTISNKDKGATIQIYYFGGSEICLFAQFLSVENNSHLKNKKTALIIEPYAKGYYLCCFCSIISSVVYLRCRMPFQAKPMNKKRFWSCLLSNGGRNCSKWLAA